MLPPAALKRRFSGLLVRVAVSGAPVSQLVVVPLPRSISVPSDVASRPPSEENASAAAVVSTPEAGGPAKLRSNAPSCALQSATSPISEESVARVAPSWREGDRVDRPQRRAELRDLRPGVGGEQAHRSGAGPRRQSIAGRRERHPPAGFGPERLAADIILPPGGRREDDRRAQAQCPAGDARRGSLTAAARRAADAAARSCVRERRRDGLVSLTATTQEVLDQAVVASQPRHHEETKEQAGHAHSNLQTYEQSSWLNQGAAALPPVQEADQPSAMNTMIRLQAPSAGTKSRNCSPTGSA